MAVYFLMTQYADMTESHFDMQLKMTNLSSGSIRDVKTMMYFRQYGHLRDGNLSFQNTLHRSYNG